MARFNAYGWTIRTLLLIAISVMAFSIRCDAARARPRAPLRGLGCERAAAASPECTTSACSRCGAVRARRAGRSRRGCGVAHRKSARRARRRPRRSPGCRPPHPAGCSASSSTRASSTSLVRRRPAPRFPPGAAGAQAGLHLAPKPSAPAASPGRPATPHHPHPPTPPPPPPPDPYFNYRVTQFLTKEGVYSMWDW
jgi:hypothetical protein